MTSTPGHRIPAVPPVPGGQRGGQGADPTFGAVNCAHGECIIGEYRDDLEAAPEHNAPEADFVCSGCGHPLTIGDLIVEAGQTWTVHDHVLGLIDTDTQAGAGPSEEVPQHGPRGTGPTVRDLPADNEDGEAGPSVEEPPASC
ncbi:hypothetical protein [Streptomyces sp. NPDC059003]|uniref:hypothetical protein n=1 Tax=Streptomyces sp. NPDC059003 TaxID=3346691 RepID=UPI00369EDE7F